MADAVLPSDGVIAASATFAAVCGSRLATAATLGSAAAPEMVKRGYGKRLTHGVVAAGATLGILIPPSIAMIIYGTASSPGCRARSADGSGDRT